MPHSVVQIDPQQPYQKIGLVYPKLVELIEMPQ